MRSTLSVPQPRHTETHRSKSGKKIRSADLWSIEHAGFVHVVHEYSDSVESWYFIKRVLLAPPIKRFWVKHVKIRTRPRPAPAFKVVAVLVIQIVPAETRVRTSKTRPSQSRCPYPLAASLISCLRLVMPKSAKLLRVCDLSSRITDFELL